MGERPVDGDVKSGETDCIWGMGVDTDDEERSKEVLHPNDIPQRFLIDGSSCETTSESFLVSLLSLMLVEVELFLLCDYFIFLLIFFYFWLLILHGGSSPEHFIFVFFFLFFLDGGVFLPALVFFCEVVGAERCEGRKRTRQSASFSSPFYSHWCTGST